MQFYDYDTRLAAYAVIVDDSDRILLALWNEGAEPTWTMPGGGVELEESPEEGAVRELREETGYDVRLGRVLGVDSHLIPPAGRLADTDRWLRSLRVVYTAEIVGGELTFEQDGTTDEARWIPLADVPDLPRSSIVDTAIAMWRADRA
ncbi:NUDIX hydrolase [Nocardioides luti]|uniref:NUDIX hydrolase n=1 Tax=Nocardioides luti TaxID=2761101 RepID=UPI001C896F8F